MHRRAILSVIVFVGIMTAWGGNAQAFPLVIKGKTLELTTKATRVELTKALSGILPGESASLDTPSRLQYDFIAVEGQGPLCLLFDFDTKGRLTAVGIDANMQVQNPVARELVAWLGQHAGPGRKIRHGRIWRLDGFSFRFTEVRDAGDESNYGVEVLRR